MAHMTRIDRRDAFAYAEAHRIAEQERYEALRDLRRAFLRWLRAERGPVVALKPSVRLG
jgi:hypothetical protein